MAPRKVNKKLRESIYEKLVSLIEKRSVSSDIDKSLRDMKKKKKANSKSSSVGNKIRSAIHKSVGISSKFKKSAKTSAETFIKNAKDTKSTDKKPSVKTKVKTEQKALPAPTERKLLPAPPKAKAEEKHPKTPAGNAGHSDPTGVKSKINKTVRQHAGKSAKDSASVFAKQKTDYEKKTDTYEKTKGDAWKAMAKYRAAGIAKRSGTQDKKPAGDTRWSGLQPKPKKPGTSGSAKSDASAKALKIATDKSRPKKERRAAIAMARKMKSSHVTASVSFLFGNLREGGTSQGAKKAWRTKKSGGKRPTIKATKAVVKSAKPKPIKAVKAVVNTAKYAKYMGRALTGKQSQSLASEVGGWSSEASLFKKLKEMGVMKNPQIGKHNTGQTVDGKKIKYTIASNDKKYIYTRSILGGRQQLMKWHNQLGMDLPSGFENYSPEQLTTFFYAFEAQKDSLMKKWTKEDKRGRPPKGGYVKNKHL